jgi:dCMP deaminase
MEVRPTRDRWAMDLAITTARRATCFRRQVGCVLLNARGHVIATGNNGVASGQPHCNEQVKVDIGDHLNQKHLDWSAVQYDVSHDCLVVNGQRLGPDGLYFPHRCPGATSKSGTDLDSCQAIHAEQNALLQCEDVYSIDTAYVTASPCITCTKLLLNTSCRRIVYRDEYPHPAARKLWTSSGRDWEQLGDGS